MAIFDDILKAVAPEDKAVFDKYPTLKTSVEAMERELHEASEYGATWNRWAQANWDPNAGKTRRELFLEQELANAGTALTNATRSGADRDTVDSLKANIDRLTTEISGVKQEALNAVGGVHLYYGKVAPLMLKHQQEFGEVLDPTALMQFMTDKHLQDTTIGYDQFVAGKRAEIAAKKAEEVQAKHAADITAAEQRGREAALKEHAMGPGGVLPTDSTGGIAGVTSRIDTKPVTLSDDMQKAIAEAKPGDGSLAALGYKLYQSGAYSGAQQ